MLRTADVMALFGGEEFVIMLPDTDPVGALETAERLRQEIEAPRDPALPHYTVSMGVAAWTQTNEEQLDIQAMINRADEALYRAKAAGRNCVSVAVANSSLGSRRSAKQREPATPLQEPGFTIELLNQTSAGTGRASK